MVIDTLDKWLSGRKKSNHSKPNKNQHPKKSHTSRPRSSAKPLRIIPLGGVEEVGKNMTAIECGNDIVVIDMGFQFPEEEMYGVDYVIPDTTYLLPKKKNIRGIIITHGHLDHIGGIPFLFKDFGHVPIYGTKLTIGLIRKKLAEHRYLKSAKLRVIHPDDTVKLGCFTTSFFRVNHSIPDGVGVVVDTPHGKVVHTGDFKFDFTPADGIMADYDKIAALGSQNVVALLSDSTNAMKPGHTVSEKTVGEALDKVIKHAPGRVIIASFSSLIGRVQQIINSCIKHNRSIYVTGRSLSTNVEIATKLGYLKYPKGLIKNVNRLKGAKFTKDAVILTTGTQGEPVSALTRMSTGNHPKIKIKPSDTVVLSSTPIIGNERSIINTINNLTALGAEVITHSIMDVHTSGHGQQEDLKLMISLVKPKYFIPVHGLLYMRKAHGKLAMGLGIQEDNIFYVNNGSVVEVNNGKARLTKEKVVNKYVVVDGFGIGDVSARITAERETMSQNGILIAMFKINKRTKKLVAKPKVITKGLLYCKELEALEKEITIFSNKCYETFHKQNSDSSYKEFKAYIAQELETYCHKQLQRKPLILPLVIGV